MQEDDSIGVRNITTIFNGPARPVLGVDVEKYKALLDDPALSDAEKESFLQGLWSIVVAFVDLGFGIHPLDEVCGQEDDPSPEALKEAFDSAERADSNGKHKRDGSPAGGLELE